MENKNDSWVDVLAPLSPAQRWVLVGASTLVLGAVALAVGKNGMIVVAKGGAVAIGSAVKLLAARS